MKHLMKCLLSLLAFILAISTSFTYTAQGWYFGYTFGGTPITIQINKPSECGTIGPSLCTIDVVNPLTLEIESRVVFREPARINPCKKAF